MKTHKEESEQNKDVLEHREENEDSNNVVLHKRKQISIKWRNKFDQELNSKVCMVYFSNTDPKGGFCFTLYKRDAENLNQLQHLSNTKINNSRKKEHVQFVVNY